MFTQEALTEEQIVEIVAVIAIFTSPAGTTRWRHRSRTPTHFAETISPNTAGRSAHALIEAKRFMLHRLTGPLSRRRSAQR
jgi:hypothetical protein